MNDQDQKPPEKKARNQITASFVDRLVGIAATITAIAAVGIAVYEARINRDYQEISVWPNMSINTNVSFAANRRFEFTIKNSGLGPAIIHDFAIKLDGQDIESWRILVDRLSDGMHSMDGVMQEGLASTSTVGTGRVVLPDEEITALQLRDETLPRLLFDNQDRISLDICYCSLFDKCWRVSRSDGGVPEPVKACKTRLKNRITG